MTTLNIDFNPNPYNIESMSIDDSKEIANSNVTPQVLRLPQDGIYSIYKQFAELYDSDKDGRLLIKSGENTYYIWRADYYNYINKMSFY